MLGFFIFGTSFKTTPIEEREKLSFINRDKQHFYKTLLDKTYITDLVVIDTCNRFELVFSSKNNIDPEEIALILKEYFRVDLTFPKNFYFHSFESAARHLFRVVSSLESLVIGEPQIVGQIKECYEYAKSCQHMSGMFKRLFDQAFRTSKSVRVNTEISKQAVSISFAAVELAKRIFSTMENKKVLLLGAGEMGQLALKHLIKKNIGKIIIANRTFETAAKLAKELNAVAIPTDQLQEYLSSVDIVISCTGTSGYMITSKMIDEVQKIRKNKPLFLIDIALPRDIDPDIDKFENTFVYDIDDLIDVVDSNKENRLKEAEKAEDIIEKQVDEFSDFIKLKNSSHIIHKLHKNAQSILLDLLAEKRFKNFSDKDSQKIERLMEIFISRLLHHPTIKTREAIAEENEDFLFFVQTLFNLEAEKEESDTRSIDKKILKFPCG